MRYEGRTLTLSDGDPVVDQLSEDGFVDLVFRIRERTHTDTHHHLRLSGRHDGQPVGLIALVRRDVKRGWDEQMQPIPDRLFPGGVVFQRSGDESDRLVTALSSLYGRHPGGPLVMVDSYAFTAVALHNEDVELERDPVHLKLFGEEGGEDEYFECFFNVDLPEEVVAWREKDTDYRDPLIGGLSTRR